MVTLDDYRPVAITIVPITMQPAVMLIEFGAWAAIVIAVPMVIPVASDPEAKTLSARYCRRCNRNGRQRGENARKLLHVASPIVVALGENAWGVAAFRQPPRNFFEWIFS